MFDITKSKPFSSLFLSQLTWDSTIKVTIKQQSRRVSVSKARLLKEYKASKAQVYNTIADSSGLSFDICKEYKISLSFLDQVLNVLEITTDLPLD